MPSVALSSQSVESLPSLVLLPRVSKLGAVVTEHAPSGVASLPSLALSPECGIVAERALSSVTLLPSSVVSLPEPGVDVIVAAIDNGATRG